MWKDAQNRDWSTAITVGALKRIKEILGFSLSEAFDALTADPTVLGDLLYAVCKPQADERQVTDMQFGELLGGATIHAASESLQDDLVFFYHCRQPEVMEQIRRSNRRLMDETKSLTIRKLNQETMDAMIKAQLIKAEAEINKTIDRLTSASGMESGSQQDVSD